MSKSILQQISSKTLLFEGAGHFFGGKQSVEVSVNDFAAKVLCDTHNNALSRLDTVAGNTFSTLNLTSQAMRATPLTALQSFHLSSGIDIERWMIKVYCGLVAAGKIREDTGNVLNKSSLSMDLFDALLGHHPLPAPLGLYHHSYVGQTRRLDGLKLGTIMLTDGSGDVGGFLLSLGFFEFALITSMDYGKRFNEPNWHRHPNLLLNLKKPARIAYLLSF